jgi:intracellular sulfur oxidation DsrE/DsrF family protein
MAQPQDRRTFLEQIGVASAAVIGAASLPPRPAMAATTGTTGGGWDMSWLDALKLASYRAVIDANTLEEGYAADLASGLLNNFQEVHGASGDQIRIVIVARRGGTPLVLGDALWNSFPISEEVKLSDSGNAPYRRNPYYRPRPGAPAESSASKLETLRQRGVILLVCNIAATNWSHRLAEMAKRDVEEVKKEVYANFVPGTIVVPSGVFGLMRAQNAGCAYMRGQ